MIVKVKKNDKGWSYFECQVMHVTRKCDIVKDIPGLAESVVIWKDNKIPEQNDKINYTRISLETYTSHLRRITTNSFFYIINDQGKTIDKL